MNVTLFRDLPTERWWSMERYADELTRALREIDCDVESYVLPRPFPQLRGTASVLSDLAWRSLAYPLAARFQQSDVNHIIDHSYAHLINSLDARRTVVTCHDIAPLALNEGHGLSRRLWNHSFRAMRRAAHIITDSTFTRNEILRYARYPAERVTVVPLAVSAEFFVPVAETDVIRLRQRYQLVGKRVILHVGSCAPRKNIELVLRAMKNLDAVFVQVGGSFTDLQNEIIAGMKAPVIQIPPAFGYALSVWYHSADIFVFPSTYEGFGMPALEAMAAGIPVICADAGPLPQITGGAAILTDPNDSTKLSENIGNVLTNARFADELRAGGIARAQEFTWARTARETIAVYQKIKR